MKRLLVILPMGALLLSGCPEPDVPTMQLSNLTDETIIFVPKDPEYAYSRWKLAPGDQRGVSEFPADCEKSPWLAQTEAGELIVEVPGGCPEHLLIIRGPGEYDYK